jgi:hypothetical protein
MFKARGMLFSSETSFLCPKCAVHAILLFAVIASN